MSKDYTTVGAFWTKISAALVLGSVLCVGGVNAQTSKSAAKPKPKEHAAVEQTDGRWSKGGLFEGFTPQQEIKEKRTRSSKHFYNADGSITAQLGRVLHYKDAQGSWQDIDLRLVMSNRTGYSFANEANDIKSYFPQAPGRQGIAMNLGNGTEFNWWQNPVLSFTQNGQTVKQFSPQPVAATAKGENLVYGQVYPGISEEFTVLPDGMENNTILHNLTSEIAALGAGAQLEFKHFIPIQAGWQVTADGQARTSAFEADRFSIRMGSADHEIYFGNIVVFDRQVTKNEALMLAGMPASKLTAEEGARLQQSVYRTTYHVRFVNGGIEVVSQLPAGWLQASHRSFPVVIDPTVTITPPSSAGYFYGPLTHWYGYQRTADLYLQSEVGSFGSITQIEYNSTTGGTAGSRPTKVYMRTTGATTLTGTDAWNSATYTGAGAALCLDANTDQGNTTGWKALTLTAPFTYDQGNLLIMVSDFWGGSGATKWYNMSSSMTSRQAAVRADGTNPGDGAAMSVENYLPETRITYNPLSQCAGLPALGSATASVSNSCSGVTFTLNLPSAPPDAGITYQWQSSVDGTTWTNLGTAQVTAPITTSQTQVTQYRVIVTCTAAAVSDTSGVVTVTMAPPTGCYCTPATSNCGVDDEIRNVTFASINNNSTCSANGYQDYTGSVAPASVTSGLSFPISVTTGPGGNESIAAWIDYNQNGVFEATEFTLVGTTEGGTVNGNIAIPGNALPGLTRMRIRNAFVLSPGNVNTIWADTPNSSCAAISNGYGETEDYAITIVAGTACSGTPVAGTAQASSNNVCPSVPINLSLAGSSAVTGLSYQWQSSPNGITWTNLGAVQNTPYYTVASQTATTSYRAIVTCANGNARDTSTAVTVTQTPLSGCYCTPVLDCTDGDLILNVTFAGINNNSTCGNNGYTNYTGTVAAPTLTTGNTYPISVTVGDGWQYESVSVWIDYNQNGVFDTNEFTYVATGTNQAVTGNIIIPNTALTGTTTMRVRVAAVGAVAATNDLPCDSDQEFGETEDYAVTILAPGGINSLTVTTQGGVPAVIPTPTGTLQLVATVLPANQPQTVTWSIVPVTGTATINASGLVTGQTAGTVWGKAVSTVDATKKDSILITINNVTPPGIDSVVVRTQGNVPAAITTSGGTLQLLATVYPLSQSQSVTWSITNLTGSATISAGGLVTAQSNGTVRAKAVSTVNTAKADSIVITITSPGLGIEDAITGADFSVFPNPTSDAVTLRSSKNHNVLQLQLMDVTGKVLVSRAIQPNELNGGVTLDLTSFSSGTYFLKVLGKDVSINKSVIRR